jgi:hypothetical protein
MACTTFALQNTHLQTIIVLHHVLFTFADSCCIRLEDSHSLQALTVPGPSSFVAYRSYQSREDYHGVNGSLWRLAPQAFSLLRDQIDGPHQ